MNDGAPEPFAEGGVGRLIISGDGAFEFMLEADESPFSGGLGLLLSGENCDEDPAELDAWFGYL